MSEGKEDDSALSHREQIGTELAENAAACVGAVNGFNLGDVEEGIEGGVREDVCVV